MKKIIVLDIIGTPNAIISAFGQQVFDQVKPEIKAGNKVVISFAGLKNCNSSFLRASVGELYIAFGEELKEKLILEDIKNEIWKNRIEETILLATNPEEAKRYQEAILYALEQ